MCSITENSPDLIIEFKPEIVAPISPYFSFSEVRPKFCKCIDWREAPNNESYPVINPFLHI